MQEKYKFKRYQMVYHVTPDSPKGIIIERRLYDDGDKEYLISYGYGATAWVFEEELSETKVLDL